MPMRSSRRRVVLTAVALTTAAVTGCIEGGFLITPVSARRQLVEEELFRESFFATDKIALIDVDGVMVNDTRFRLLGEGEHPVSMLLEQLDEARRDRSVKAVILRINSPGGTVVASELMHDEITHFKKKTGKPVIALIMDVGASGGYYIACACDEIVAQHSTVTGSIGVIMQTFEVSGTMNMIGVTTDAIISGVHKDTGSPLREMRPEERELFQRIVNEMYERFVRVVDEGRPKLDEARVRALADGRVYVAAQALEEGLIDRIATVRETIQAVKKRVGARKIRLVAYRRPLAYRANYYARAPQPAQPDTNIINIDLPGWLSFSSPRFMYLWVPGR